MRAVVQRVDHAEVRVGGDTVGKIGSGLLAFVGVGGEDAEADAYYLAEKTVNLRIFEDDDGKMNRSLLDTGGGLLAVSQFTLLGDCRKGRRPAFVGAMEPKRAEALFNRYVERAGNLGASVETGRFRAMMEVDLVNSGPVTLLLDSTKLF